MFITHGIPSILQITSVYRFADHVSIKSNSIIIACMAPIVIFTLPFGYG